MFFTISIPNHARPYLCYYAVQFVQVPKTPHLVAVKRILRYIKATITHGLRFTNNSPKHRIYGYCDCDCDFVGDPNTRKPTIRQCFHK